MKLFSKENAVGLIGNSVRGDRLSHAYIICGEKGVGKKTLARYMALQILCERQTGEPCGVCKSCRMMAISAHPDFIAVTPAGKSGNYLADDLRAIIPDASIAPNEGSKKIYFLPGIDKALPAAQNTLLKIIEEPPAHVVFIMTAESKERILPTILSRAICINLPECTEEECIEALSEQGISAESAKDAVSKFGGNIGKCLEYLNDGGAKAIYGTVLEITDAVVKGDGYAILAAFTAIDRDRSACLDVLGALKTVLRDAVCTKLGAPLCSVCRENAAAIAEKFRRSRIEKMYEDVSNAETRIAANASTQLVLADLCGKLSG